MWRAFIIALLASTPVWADGAGGPLTLTNSPDQLGKFVVGVPCGMCHDALSGPQIGQVESLLTTSVMFHDTPIGDVFVGYQTHPPTPPSVPLPGTIWLLGVPLLWLGKIIVTKRPR